MSNSLANLVAENTRREAEKMPALISSVSGLSTELAAQKMQQMVEQDPARTSWRVWGAFWSGCAAVLAIPEVQTGLQVAIGAVVPVAWAPVVPAIMGVVWPIVSKVKDKRQVRSAPWEI